jgi:hypothetical protein
MNQQNNHENTNNQKSELEKPPGCARKSCISLLHPHPSQQHRNGAFYYCSEECLLADYKSDDEPEHKPNKLNLDSVKVAANRAADYYLNELQPDQIPDPNELVLDLRKLSPLKMEINEIVWRNCKGSTTLEQADDLSIKILDLLDEYLDDRFRSPLKEME